MPRKRSKFAKKKRYAKKRFNKKRSKFTKSLSCKTIGGFPDRYYAKLRCATSHNATFVSTPFSLSFKLNSLLTPIGGSGICTGWQNFLGAPSSTAVRQAIYCNYIVHGVTAKVWAITEVQSTNNYAPRLTVVPLPRTISSSTVNAFNLAEMPRARSRVLNANVTADALAVKPMKIYYNMHDVIGIKRRSDIHLLDSLSDGTITTDPTDTRYAVIQISPDDGSGTDSTLAMKLDVELTYYVEFFNRNLQFIS